LGAESKDLPVPSSSGLGKAAQTTGTAHLLALSNNVGVLYCILKDGADRLATASTKTENDDK